MPEPKKGEPLNQFVARFIQAKREKRSFSDPKQKPAESRKTKGE